MSIFPLNYKIQDQRVWPYPKKIEKGDSSLIISRKLRTGDFSGPGKSHIDPVIIDEFNRFVFFESRPRSSIKTSFSIEIDTEDSLSTVAIDESYILDIKNDGGISIKASSYVGAIHGLSTLSQLIRRKNKQYIVEKTPIHIEDTPGVAHREVMLDNSRQFLSVPVLKKQIRAMALQKLNYLHLHITDGQSFPLMLDIFSGAEVDGYTPLASGMSYTEVIALGKGHLAKNMGAYSKEEVYTSDDIKEIVDYAKAYGIIVIPEIDTPGHTYSWMYGFPEIMTCNTKENQTDACCPEPPCGFLNLEDKMPEVQTVVKGVFLEVIKAFQLGKNGYGTYFHLGFDEVGCPMKDTKTGACIAPSCKQAYGVNSVKFLNWLLSWFKAKQEGLTTILWVDQILDSNFNPIGKYTPNIVLDKKCVILQFWTLDDPKASLHIKYMAETEGFKIINSQATTYYLDSGGQGNSFTAGGPIMSDNNGIQKLTYQKNWISAYPGVAACTQENCVGLNKGWQVSFEDIYLNNITYLPTDTRALLDDGKIQYEQISLDQGKGGVIGAAIAVWGEQIDSVNLDQKLWPKASAFAESLWKFDANRLPDNIVNAKFRLIFFREDLLRLGVYASPMVPGDVFRNAPWGPLKSETTCLMHDVNNLSDQQFPEGYLFSYWSHWYTGTFCTDLANKTTPINPFCGPKMSPYMTCDKSSETYFIQQNCPQPKGL